MIVKLILFGANIRRVSTHVSEYGNSGSGIASGFGGLRHGKATGSGKGIGSGLGGREGYIGYEGDCGEGEGPGDGNGDGFGEGDVEETPTFTCL